MVEVLKKFLLSNGINLENENVCIGISTGVDSSCLLYALEQLQKSINFNIILCHVNHGKRRQSIIEEQYIKEYASNKGLKIHILHIHKQDIKDNFQSEARKLRLKFFNEILTKYNGKYIFLAHHLNDDIETSFMHIIRGSSLKGYYGMDKVSYGDNSSIILRPFLDITKDEIIEYAKKNNITYFLDKSNLENHYTRNRIRHKIIPYCFMENPSFSTSFFDFKESIQYAYSLIEKCVDSFINSCEKNQDAISFSIDSFLKQDSFIQIEILFRLLKNENLSKKNILELIKIIKGKKANHITKYKYLCFKKQYSKIIISNELESLKIDEVVITSLGRYDLNEHYYLTVEEFSFEDYKKNKNILTNLRVVWYNNSIFPFSIRNRKNGDKMKVNSGTKKVKDILIDEKIPSSIRDELFLLEHNNEILTIFDVKKSQTLLDSKANSIIVVLKEKNNEYE